MRGPECLLKNPAPHDPYEIVSAEPLLFEFTIRPYYYQDVAYGTCSIKVTSREEFVMPNVVRSVAMCTIINSTYISLLPSSANTADSVDELC